MRAMQKTESKATKTKAQIAGLLATVVLMSAAGCSDKIESGGPDIAYLNASLTPQAPAGEAGQSFLPLSIGNVWEMNSFLEAKQSRDRLVVTKQISSPPGTQIEIQRGGKMWRREIVRSNKEGIWLSAMQDETSPLMQLDPPLPILKYPVREGNAQEWKGTFKMGKESAPARGYSRISTREDARTAAGKFKAARVDTVIIVARRGGEIRFPMVRWLAPSVGYVRRGYAEKGKPAFSDLTRFDLKEF